MIGKRVAIDFNLEAARSQYVIPDKPFHEWTFPSGIVWTRFYRINAGYLLRFPDLADFFVSTDGRTVTCTPVPGVSEATPEHLYLNQVLPLALSKLGKLVFHASAVEIEGFSIAFVAESGRGKSTLATSFSTSGFRFLTDDGLLVEPYEGGYEVVPSHPSVRLWEDSQAALVATGTIKAPPLCFTAKSRFLAGSDLPFCTSPRQLRKVYFLGDGSATALTIQRMSAADALVEWIKHTFLLDVDEQPLLATHFDQVAKLANQSMYFRLDYPRRFEELAHVRQAIVEHARQED